MKKMTFMVPLLVFCLFLGWQTSLATEGGGSNYFPGAAATFGVAIAPEPGFMVANQMFFYSAKASAVVLRGHVHLDVEANAFYNYFTGAYTFDTSVLGGRFQIGAAVPVGHLRTRVGMTTAFFGSREISESDTAIGDSIITPALFWDRGDFHFKLSESITAPTGEYSLGNLANIGRNYWSFDTSLAATWMSKKTGTEISIVPGIMFNTRNTETDYHSGNEFHVDFMVNQFLSKSFALGFQGYYYHQLTGDSGSGAKLGEFKGESLGIGPALLWTPEFGKGNLSVVAKWLHDIDDKHRMKGNYGQLTVAYKF